MGREDELGELRERLGRGRPVALTGSAGIGKTALLEAAVAEHRAPTFKGGALSNLGWVPYLPLTRALSDLGLNGDAAAAAAAVREAVGGGLLALDDVHWADSETLSLLPLLAREITLLVAVRQGDPGTERALEAVEAGGFERIDLAPLDDSAAVCLLRTARPELEPDAQSRLLGAADGNPLLLLELAADGSVSPTLRISLEARLSRCSPAAEESLALLALLGRPAPAELLGPGAAELVDAGLATDGADGLSPKHALISEAVSALLDDPRRRSLHERLARLLDDPGQSARHFQAAGLRELARERALAAVASARRPGERSEHLRIAAACSAGATADRLRLEAADALITAGRFTEAEELARSIEGTDPAVQAHARLLRGRARWAAADSAGATDEYERGLELAGGEPSPTVVRLHVELVRVMLWSGQDAVGPAREAVELATRAGAHVALAHCLLGCALGYPSGSDEALEHFDIALAQAEFEEDHDLAFETAFSFAATLHQYGRGHEGFAVVEEARRRARRLRLRGWEISFRWLAGRLLYIHQGEYPRAIRELEACSREPTVAYPNSDQITADLAVALARIGRVDEARAALARDGSVGSGWWGRQTRGWAEGEVELAAGRPERAAAAAERALVESAGPVGFHLALLRDLARLDLGLPPGPPVDAQMSEDSLTAHCAPALSGLALLAEERYAESEQRFLEASRLAARVSLEDELRWLWAAGEAARRAGDLTLARTHLLTVEERASAHALEPLLARIRRSLRLAGIRRSAAPAPKSGSLTPREREVLRQVAAGATSRQIARRLGIAPGTVDGLVKSSMAKLGARTRRQAAALVEAG